MPHSDPNNLASLFTQRVDSDRDRVAIHVFRGGRFQPLTWGEISADVLRMAATLARLGVEPEDRVVQWSDNRYEWIVTDLAILAVRAIHVPVHAPLSGAQAAYQIQHSGSRLAILDTDEQVRKLANAPEGPPADVTYLTHDPSAVALNGAPPEYLPDRLRDADNIAGEQLQRLAQEQLASESIATILYTSGTTGEPKGVVLTHGNILSNVLALLAVFREERSDRRLCFLPLSHIFARTCDLYTWMGRGSELALAQSRDTILPDCEAVEPTLLNGVPYFFERIHRRMIEAGKVDEPGCVKQLLGGRIRACVSGGAALQNHTYDFFEQHGLPILQGYGLTESSPVITASTEESYRRGTVGPPIPGVEVRIAEDGEILTRGPHVMVGYWNDPEGTAAVIRDGWLYTGDLGELDDDGFLRITTGRKKELIVTAAGKNIAPSLIESLLCRDPLIEQAIVIGDDRSYLVALIVPHEVNLRRKIKERRLWVWSKRRAVTHPRILELYERRIEQQLANLSHHEQVRRFRLLDRGFTIEGGHMTPKASLRREEIQRDFAREIEALFD